jgi:glycosyltransferase involved in cell wall biosynthesis
VSELVFIVPGRLDQLTGGYLFDRHLVEGSRRRGRAVRVIELAANDPAAGAAALAALADGTPTVIDGLALADHGPVAAEHAARLRLVALVHHPLAQETGLSPATAARLARLEAAVLPRFRGILCPSPHTAAALANCGVAAARIAVVAPGTERPARPLRRRRGRVRALLCVASVVPRKGHRVLVAALARLRDLDWRLVCIGSLKRDPATAHAVRRMILATGLGRRVTLAGEQPPHRVAQAYRTADAFVLPSFHEGYGMAYAEAMAHGLPVVATVAGAIPETVPGEAGLLVPPGDPAALARALRRLLAEPGLAVQLARGSRTARARLRDWRQATEHWNAAFDRLAALEPPR